MPERLAYLNSQWVDDSALAIPVGDPGFALGVTITERLRTFEGQVWRQAEHIARMRHSAEIVGIPVSVVEELDAAVTEFECRLRALREPGDDWAVVAFATPGLEGEPTRCVHGFPLLFNQWAHQYAEGVHLHTSDHRQTPANCWPTELKCRSRMHYYLADQQAREIEPDSRALLLDQEGFVGEASTANLVIYNQREGIVSPRMEKVFPGVSVAVLSELAKSQAIRFNERDLTLDEFLSADEAWLASTSVCLLPVTSLDNQLIGAGEPGPVFHQLLAAWNDAVGLDIAAQARAQSKARQDRFGWNE